MSQSQQPRTELRSQQLKITHLARALFLSGGIIFTIFNTIAESIYPDFNVGKDALSNLGALGHNTTFLWDGQLFIASLLGLLAVTLLFFRSSLSGYLRGIPIRILYFLPGDRICNCVPFPGQHDSRGSHSGSIHDLCFWGDLGHLRLPLHQSSISVFFLAPRNRFASSYPISRRSVYPRLWWCRTSGYSYTICGITFGAYLTAL
jgi:hypothetical protein